MLLVIVAGVLWGTIGLGARAAFRWGLSPAESALWRAGGGFLLLLPAAAASGFTAFRIRARDLPLFAAFGLIGVAVFMTVYFEAIRRSTLATAAILLYTGPAWVVLLARLFYREPLTTGKAAAVALAFAGSALVVRVYDPAALRLSLPGVAAGLAAGLTYGLYSIFGKGALRRYGPLTTLLYSLGLGALFLIIATVAAARRLPMIPPVRAAPVLLYLSLVPTLLAHACYINGLRRVEAGRAAILATAEPVVAALVGFLLLGEALDGWQWLGGALVLAGMALAAR